ncbi:DUF423 domain-containing protein [Pelagibacterium halotolerans]|uniref:DUF423 domain-containing protein n=1 Tax=Pelagibacterium halotolerans (strain DSM 22347 / JCM 15775 / CGMCC 1.7692 / B2) TaxID=1082931 RepID=G4R6N7_PELHB|nr:DUF423 domain-containing protein [Pelagibacterium halotolerans]AEQ52199.1 hypothetical protein KKY_2190 [Pelagibacterium halotolerans B2]QJR18045.1 DUF423 domain-containing protein [Pelagibacterium halotolerans]SEA95310.1 Uncharacterized membrane protein YgdD, TMEM256/DUF423 family [Pelagibacterium halotolerans]
MTPLERLAIVLAGLLGASGIAAAAASSHAGAALLGPYSLIALTHAPAILALALVPLPRIFNLALIGLMIGAGLFCADLALRYFAGASPLPLLAPLGGMTLIAGWLLVLLGGVFGRRN